MPGEPYILPLIECDVNDRSQVDAMTAHPVDECVTARSSRSWTRDSDHGPVVV